MHAEEPRLKLWSADTKQKTFFVTRSTETSDVFNKGTPPWMFVHDLPQEERHEGELGSVLTTSVVAVRICEMVWSHNNAKASDYGTVANVAHARGDLEADPWIWIPQPGSRVIKMAWLSSVRPTHVRPTFIPKMREVLKEQYKRTAVYDPEHPEIPNPIPSHPVDVAYPHAFPGEVNQPIILRRTFETPQFSMRWIFAAWEELPSLS